MSAGKFFCLSYFLVWFYAIFEFVDFSIVAVTHLPKYAAADTTRRNTWNMVNFAAIFSPGSSLFYIAVAMSVDIFFLWKMDYATSFGIASYFFFILLNFLPIFRIFALF